MTKPFPEGLRDDIVNVASTARTREPGQAIKQIAAGFGIAESCLDALGRLSQAGDGRQARPWRAARPGSNASPITPLILGVAV